MGTLLISCSDGRLSAALDELLRQLDAQDADRFLVPGGPLALTRTGAERRVTKDDVASIVAIHAIRRIVLVSHQDCFAYERILGGPGFDQMEILERDLLRAKTLVEQEFLGVHAECYVVSSREGEGAAPAPARRVD